MPTDSVPFVPPEAADALAQLDMPMAEAMRTQRAVRRLHLDPVSRDVLLRRTAAAVLMIAAIGLYAQAAN